MLKLDRERILADLKKFQTNFKVSRHRCRLAPPSTNFVQVPLPMPKDILPLLAKDEEKQRSIEALAASNLESVKARKVSVDAQSGAKSPPPSSTSRKISMHVAEIPPFKARQPPAPPKVELPESANRDIPLAISPTPSANSHASGTNLAAKLNPNANAFVFKPNPSAVAFKPVSCRIQIDVVRGKLTSQTGSAVLFRQSRFRPFTSQFDLGPPPVVPKSDVLLATHYWSICSFWLQKSLLPRTADPSQGYQPERRLQSLET